MTRPGGGFTWSAPVKVNQTPRSATPGNQQAFLPAVHVAADRTVAVTYYDFRNYEGLASIGNRFTPVFIQVNNGNAANRTDNFFTTAGP